MKLDRATSSSSREVSPCDQVSMMGCIRQQVAKWQRSQKSIKLAELKEHEHFEVKVNTEEGKSPVASVLCRICGKSFTLSHKCGKVMISNWTRHIIKCLQTPRQSTYCCRRLDRYFSSPSPMASSASFSSPSPMTSSSCAPVSSPEPFSPAPQQQGSVNQEGNSLTKEHEATSEDALEESQVEHTHVDCRDLLTFSIALDGGSHSSLIPNSEHLPLQCDPPGTQEGDMQPLNPSLAHFQLAPPVTQEGDLHGSQIPKPQHLPFQLALPSIQVSNHSHSHFRLAPPVTQEGDMHSSQILKPKHLPFQLALPSTQDGDLQPSSISNSSHSQEVDLHSIQIPKPQHLPFQPALPGTQDGDLQPSSISNPSHSQEVDLHSSQIPKPHTDWSRTTRQQMSLMKSGCVPNQPQIGIF